ncbi:MAG: hypothetical protein IPI75_02760 [Gammaproteobacteria bacterium]|nr:hypothetical protein [Gammaproteobacteria bacterium]
MNAQFLIAEIVGFVGKYNGGSADGARSDRSTAGIENHPAANSKTVLERTRLGSGLAEFAEKSVITLQAAAGSGKTSLLAQWRKEALVAGAIVAWLTLDDGDNDSQLARGLTVAMRASSGSAGLRTGMPARGRVGTAFAGGDHRMAGGSCRNGD